MVKQLSNRSAEQLRSMQARHVHPATVASLPHYIRRSQNLNVVLSPPTFTVWMITRHGYTFWLPIILKERKLTILPSACVYGYCCPCKRYLPVLPRRLAVLSMPAHCCSAITPSCAPSPSFCHLRQKCAALKLLELVSPINAVDMLPQTFTYPVRQLRLWSFNELFSGLW